MEVITLHWCSTTQEFVQYKIRKQQQQQQHIGTAPFPTDRCTYLNALLCCFIGLN